MSGRPGQACTICRHKELARIELRLAGGRSLTEVGSEFGLHRSSLARHWTKHVTLARKAELICGPVQLNELAKIAAENDMSTLQWLAVIRGEAWSCYREARERGLLLDASSILRTMLGTLRQASELTGEIRGSGLYVTNIHGDQNIAIVKESAIDVIRAQIEQYQRRTNGADTALPLPLADEAEEAAE